MPDVQVTFGAKIDDLVSGVNEVKSHLDDLKGKFEEVKQHTEGISSGIGTLSSGLKEFAATFLAAFSIEGIANFAVNMANLGVKMEGIKYSMGLSAQSVVELAGVAKLTGTNIETLTQGIERMALNIQRATRDSTNPFAQAMKNLGLSTKDFIGLNGAQYFELLAGAVAKFNPDMNLTTNLVQLGGRSFKDMIPALIQGKEAIENFRTVIRQATEGLAAAQPGMNDTRAKMDILSLSVDGLRARIFTTLKPAIDEIIKKFTEWAQSIDSETIVRAVNNVADWMIRAVRAIGEFVNSLGAIVDKVKQKIDELIGPLQTAYNWANNLSLAILKMNGMDLTSGANSFENRWKDATSNSLRQVSAWEAGVIKAINAVRDSANTLKLPPEGAPVGGPDKAPPLTFPGRGDDGIAQAMRQIQIVDQQYQMEVEKINHAFKMSVDIFGSAEAQKTQTLLAAINTRVTAELAALDQVQARYAAGSKEYQKIEDEKTKIVQKAALDRQKVNDQAAEQSWQKWKSTADEMAGAFNSNLRSMLTGQMTFTQAIGRMTGDMIIKWTGDLVKMAFEWVAKQLFMSSATKAIQATDLATHTATEATKTAATTAGVAARTGAEASGASLNIFAQIGQAISFIFTQAAKTFAGVFAFLSPVMGPAAAGPATASSTEVMAVAATLPALASGTDYVSRAGMAMIHAGEQIVPAQTSGPYTGANAGGGITNHFSFPISTIDGASVQRWLNSGGGQAITKFVSAAMSRNPSLRPSY